MWLGIVVGVVVISAAAWALWPRRRGVVDADVRRQLRHDQGRVEEHRARLDIPNGPV
jgi:hypothetical protein